ncbi:hypothetical protein RN96_10865 [Fusobacterium polymorphum]|uniref:Uncharacterized protein n=1 Tax=Fusobacterium nucleatum subsp. polymorphum TaxID=76857 RepID=A0A2B7YIF6_FUSNP|nr:hypothetical protein [Fusobacterium polymorphum]PGH20652.1 hypothetical protein RN96_10865 [Fusobacterium polymorphum]
MKKFNYIIAILFVIVVWVFLYMNSDQYIEYNKYISNANSFYLDSIFGKIVFSYVLFTFSKLGADVIDYSRKIPYYRTRSFLADLVDLLFIKFGLANLIGGLIGGGISLLLFWWTLEILNYKGISYTISSLIIIILTTIISFLVSFVIKMLEEVNKEK